MSYTTSVPPITFQNTGIVLPEEAAILTGVEADLNTAFGGNLSQSLSSPQGQLAQSLTAIIGDNNDTFAYLVNQIDPMNSSGSFQDAIGRIYFQTRKAATATVVSCTCTGVSGTVIPAGSYAKDTNNYTYKSVTETTIPPSGTVLVDFQNTQTGPISVAASTLTTIVSAVNGWDAITNASVGVVGTDEESQQEFEYRRLNTVAINSRGSVAAIKSRVLSVDGVTDCYVQANPTGAAANYGSTSYSIPAHSVYVAVEGGDSEAVANAIWLSKSAGCDTVGNNSVVVYDTEGYETPYPEYLIKYNTPTQTDVYFVVNLINDPNLPSDIITQVKSAISGTFYGDDSLTKRQIGSTIYSSRYYSAVSSISNYANLMSITVGTSANPTATYHTMGIDQIPVLSTSNITVNLV